MRGKLVAFLALIIAFSAAELRAQNQFSIYASVVDSTGKPVESLQPADVRVMEGGKEAKVVKIETIEGVSKVQILVDNGVGLGNENLIHLRNGLRALLETIPEGTEVTVVSTAPQPRFLVRATTDRKQLLDGVDRLAPDSGAGRFVDSLNEATQRTERDKTEHFPIIISAATTAGDNNILERDVERLMERLQKKPTTVHVVLLSAGSRSGSAGANQTNIGINVTKFTRGTYENIAVPSRLATLLPEIGKKVADSMQRQGRQFKITLERPDGASGNLGQISMGARNGLQTAGLSMDGRMP